MSLLSDEEEFTIILSSIRDYKKGENDIAILIVEKVSKQLINCLNEQITTQDIFDEIIECFNFYNNFVKEKKINLKTIPEEMYDLVEYYLNSIVEEMQKEGSDV